jgi:hypothetical protein
MKANKNIKKFYALLEKVANTSFDCGEFTGTGDGMDTVKYQKLLDSQKLALCACEIWVEEQLAGVTVTKPSTKIK